MILPRLKHQVFWVGLLGLLLSHLAFASGLQVTPVSFSFKPGVMADSLWLANTGNTTLFAQIRVYQWHQADNKQHLAATQDFAASPPMVEIAPGVRQLVRLVRKDPGSAGDLEAAYRIFVNEIPGTEKNTAGLHFLLEYSIPVFVESKNPAAEPKLNFKLAQDGDALVLDVVNEGQSHAQLVDLFFLNQAGQRIKIHSGLLGYVLPGVQRHWRLKSESSHIAGEGTLEVLINGEPSKEPIKIVKHII